PGAAYLLRRHPPLLFCAHLDNDQREETGHAEHGALGKHLSFQRMRQNRGHRGQRSSTVVTTVAGQDRPSGGRRHRVRAAELNRGRESDGIGRKLAHRYTRTAAAATGWAGCCRCWVTAQGLSETGRQRSGAIAMRVGDAPSSLLVACGGNTTRRLSRRRRRLVHVFRRHAAGVPCWKREDCNRQPPPTGPTVNNTDTDTARTIRPFGVSFGCV
ncbi:unnamed protein product, partial [Ectocarpus fasciculatus]